MLIWIAKRIDRKRYRMVFCTLSKWGALNESLAEMGFEVFALDVKGIEGIPGGVWRFRKMMKKIQPSLVHSHLLLGGLFGALCAPKSGHIHHRHYGNFFRGPGAWLSKMLDFVLVHVVDQFVAVSPAVMRDLTQRLGVEEHKVITLENAIDLDVFDPDKVKNIRNGLILETIAKARRPLIGMVANFHPGKGHLVLLQAIEKLLGHFPNLQVLLFGEGAGESALRQRVQELNLENQVTFCGFEKDIAAVISKFDLLVVPSLSEGFGLVACEAMALGVGVVASRLEGLADIVIDEQTGLLFEGGNADALGAAIFRILSDHGLRKKIVSQARDIVQDRFSMEKYVVTLQEIYDRKVGVGP